ncbi:MAG TPA: phosphate acyltransferase PlsX [Chloroflexota bacterium]|nr:phosphate acyltransferase PlsX [Chloroflexota bacterium]
MRIALDAMGGDNAPAEPIAGAVLAARDLHIPVSLVGPHDLIARELGRHENSQLPIEIVDAPDIIHMADHPVEAVRRLKGSSMNVAVQLVKSGAADGFVTAGNTGAAMVSALFGLGRLSGIERPALATIFPTQKGHCLVLDIGANTDCRPEHLLQFGRMGERYSRLILGTTRPRVGLLSNGEEESKGNKLVQEAHVLLRGSDLNFVGNIEGKDIPRGSVDVVVCDGFVGNVMVKLAEGIAEFTFGLLREELTSSIRGRIGAILVRPSLSRLKHRVDYQEYGGAPLLGVAGIVIVAHGRSRAVTISNAIRVASKAAKSNLLEALGPDDSVSLRTSSNSGLVT